MQTLYYSCPARNCEAARRTGPGQAGHDGPAAAELCWKCSAAVCHSASAQCVGLLTGLVPVLRGRPAEAEPVVRFALDRCWPGPQAARSSRPSDGHGRATHHQSIRCGPWPTHERVWGHARCVTVGGSWKPCMPSDGPAGHCLVGRETWYERDVNHDYPFTAVPVRTGDSWQSMNPSCLCAT